MAHVVLLGDSIFDNGSYVPGRPDVAEQLRRALPRDCSVTLLALDGAIARDVAAQARRVPPDATHLFVSVGGNDALGNAWMINDTEGTTQEAFRHLAQAQQQFRRDYQLCLQSVLARAPRTAVCTIYDGVPGLAIEELTALSVWNDVILREAFRAGVPVLDLRLICADPRDYSSLSPIEPSAQGGAKIAAAILRVAAGHDFGGGSSVVYGPPDK
jgi:lysophospholipase L1-like esterase